jgi:hypothetical protein
VVENGGGACKNPWQLARGKRFLAQYCWLRRGEMYPAGRSGPWWGKIPEADGDRSAAPEPGLRQRCCRVGAGLESEGRHLVLLVADVQHKVVQGAANDGVGVVIQQLERRYMAVPPYEQRRCKGVVIGQLRRRLASSAVLCLLERCSAALSVLKIAQENFLKVILGNLKIGQVK